MSLGQRRFLVIDDHEAILEGTVPALQAKYPMAEILNVLRITDNSTLFFQNRSAIAP